MKQVVSIGGQPRAPTKSDWIVSLVIPPDHDLGLFILALNQMYLPRGLAPPLAETFAFVFEIALIMLVHQCHSHAHKSGRCDLSGKVFQVPSAIPCLIQVRQILAYMPDKNQVRKIFCLAGSADSMSVYRCMLDVLCRRELFELIQLLFHSSLRFCQQFVFVAGNTLRYDVLFAVYIRWCPRPLLYRWRYLYGWTGDRGICIWLF